VARRAFDALVEQHPEGVSSRGHRGFVAASSGDSAQALEDLEWLAHLRDRYVRRVADYWRAAISGALGRVDEAVDLLRQAYGEGLRYDVADWYSPELDPLRDNPGFKELLRPKG
jgi:hypothetical protein